MTPIKKGRNITCVSEKGKGCMKNSELFIQPSPLIHVASDVVAEVPVDILIAGKMTPLSTLKKKSAPRRSSIVVAKIRNDIKEADGITAVENTTNEKLLIEFPIMKSPKRQTAPVPKICMSIYHIFYQVVTSPTFAPVLHTPVLHTPPKSNTILLES